jgi:hypothetical protein
MGLFDEIRWDAPLPEGHPPDSRLFQTKSLDPCMDYYVVTPEGRLLLVGSGFEDGADLAGKEISQGIDVEFHGDMRLLSAEGYREYLARFTHGTLEWIRPLADGEPWTTVAAAGVKLGALPGRTRSLDGGSSNRSAARAFREKRSMNI